VSVAAGLGLVPGAFVVFRNSERGGMGRPPVVLGLTGMAGSSASVRAGGMVLLFCCWNGGAPGGGANCDCGCPCSSCCGVGLRGGASLYDWLGVGACCVIVGFGRVCSCGLDVGCVVSWLFVFVFVPGTTPELEGSFWSTTVSWA
jgi:hypothetical protein